MVPSNVMICTFISGVVTIICEVGTIKCDVLPIRVTIPTHIVE